MNNLQRSFFLGDSWLYFKIYTGFKTADYILQEIIFPLTQQLEQERVISHWFFIRYSDPDFHIRVRMFLLNTDDLGSVTIRIKQSLQPYFNDMLIWKIQHDTYNREIERYGQKTIELTEQYFCADSEMVIKLLKLLEIDNSEKLRWLLTLRAIDELLISFGYPIERKLSILNILQENYKKEFGIEGHLNKQFSLNFRENRKEIEKIIKINQEEYPLLKPIYDKTEKVKMIVSDILGHVNNNMLEVSLDSLIMSYIHMMINRFFRAKPREHELILYDYLYRFYESEISRKKYESIRTKNISKMI